MEKYKFQSKNESTLLDKALEELNVKEEEIVSRLYEEKGGLFSGKKFTLEVVKLSEISEVGIEMLLDVLTAFDVKPKVDVKIKDGQIQYQICSQNNSLLIGKNGHILDSIQTYIRQAIYNTVDLYVNVTVDVENYKEKQNYFLEKKVKKIARDVTLSKVDVALDPMNSYERKIVHSALQGFKYISTESEGEEPNRRIVIRYVEGKDEKED